MPFLAQLHTEEIFVNSYRIVFLRSILISQSFNLLLAFGIRDILICWTLQEFMF